MRQVACGLLEDDEMECSSTTRMTDLELTATMVATEASLAVVGGDALVRAGCPAELRVILRSGRAPDGSAPYLRSLIYISD